MLGARNFNVRQSVEHSSKFLCTLNIQRLQYVESVEDFGQNVREMPCFR